MNRIKPQQLKQMIWQGEGVNLDFKKTITSCEKIAKTLVAFANNQGGKLFIGVADDGNIKGVKAEDEEKYMIEKAATLFVKPIIEPLFEEVYIDDKIVLVVDIPKSDLKPHYALNEEENKWWVYIRVKDKSILASKIIVDVLKREHLQNGVLIEYSEKEKNLFSYLELHQKITLKEFTELVKTSRKKASTILVNLILSGLIKANHTEQEEFYTVC